MELRRARPEEYAAIGDVTVAAYDGFLDGPEDPYRDRLRDVATRDTEAEVWVAVGDDGAVLGNVTVCPPGSPWCELADDTAGEGEFRMLAVSPAAQGRGVGRALAGLVIDRFRTDGARVVVLSSLRDMSTAHALYERIGFERAPSRDWSPYPGVQLIAYTLELR
ncbi:GNAT family N-acetyltransferase [soil metagenome]